MSQTLSRAEQLRAIINGGQISWPLSHGNALEIISKLNGAKDWNTLSARGENNSAFKEQAKVLRRSFAAKRAKPPISADVADAIVDSFIQPTGPIGQDRHIAAKPSMDDLLSFLDLEKEKIGSILVGQDGDWITAEAELIVSVAKRTVQRTVEAIQIFAAKDLPSDQKAKAEMLAADLAKTNFPNPKKTTYLADVEGLWHGSVESRNSDAKLGMADYVMKVTQHRLRLRFDATFKTQDDEMPWNSRPDYESFKEWLVAVPSDLFSGNSSSRWLWTVNPKHHETVAFFCFPSIPDISRVVRKLRRFTDEMKEGSVIVCAPDAHALEIIAQQKIGIVRYPTVAISSKSIRETLRPPQPHSSHREYWAPWLGSTFPSYDSPDSF